MKSKIQKQKEKQDYSKQDQSTLYIRSYDYYELERDIKRIKYPTYSISNAEGLETKISSFKDEILRNELHGLLVNLNSYRKVRGDGNCFFRALAFCYLAQAADPSVTCCFTYLNQIRLTCCIPSSIPPDFKPFYSHDFLSKMLEGYWERVYTKYLQESDSNARKALIKVFDQCPFLDFIVVLYFRALCLKGLWKFEEELKQYLLGKQQEYIRTYSQQTEGVSINICSMLLKIVINVYEIRKGVVKVYHYDNVVKKGDEIHLLFYQNHYDIIQKNEQIEAEENSLSKNAFYSDLNRKRVLGICLQCDQQKSVFEDSAICLSCFEKIQRVAKQYDTGKTKRGRCQDCYFLREDILEDLGICKKCMKAQNEAEEKRKFDEKKKSEQKEKAEKDIKENDITEVKKQDQKKQEKPPKFRGKCVLCDTTWDLDSQTGICQYCIDRQKIALKREQKRRESRQKPQPKPEPQKQVPTSPNDEYYQRYRLKQQKSPQKISKIGTQIKKEPHKSILSSTNEKIKKEECSYCKKEDTLESETPICKRCYNKFFNEFSYCGRCKYKFLIHEQTGKCKKCHFSRYEVKPTSEKPSNSQLNQKYCSKCLIKPVLFESLCQDCHLRYTCRSCKKTSFTAIMINAVCPTCRNRRN